MYVAFTGYLWVQLRNKGIIVEALANVALHMADAALCYGPQPLQQRRGAARHEARRNDGMHQHRIEAPAPGDALKALQLALCWHRSMRRPGLLSLRLPQ